MLTAILDGAIRLEGFAAGVDDFVLKPFQPRELLARIRSVLRRMDEADGTAPLAPTRLPVGPHLLDVGSRSLTDRSGRSRIGLTGREMALLLAFLRHPGQTLSRERLALLVDGEAPDAGSRSMDLRIARLRRKIEADPAAPRLIRTIPGEGYAFEPGA
jgi:DNA-binding response OmpR family regulator